MTLASCTSFFSKISKGALILALTKGYKNHLGDSPFDLVEPLAQRTTKLLCELSNLQILSLVNNQINKLPETIGKLIALQRLYLLGNQIVRLPLAIRKLKALFEPYRYNIISNMRKFLNISHILKILTWYGCCRERCKATFLQPIQELL